MTKFKELARIDKYTCKFENPVMEDRFMGEKWERVKKAVSFALIFFAITFVFDAYSVYNMLGEFRPILLGYPVFLFLSVIWFTSKLANNTEVIALLSSGISFNRFIRPFMISASIVAIFAFLLACT